MRAATAAAEPDDEPPGVCSRFHGLRVGAGSRNANCVVCVLPRMIAPLARSICTDGASCVGRRCAHAFAPAVVGMPSTSKMSLMPTGMPCSGPRSLPRFRLFLAQRRLRARARFVDVDPRLERRVERADAREARLDERDGRQRAALDRVAGGDGGQRGRVRRATASGTSRSAADEVGDDLVDGAAARVDGDVRLRVKRLARAVERDDVVVRAPVEHRPRALPSRARQQLRRIAAQPDDGTEPAQRLHHPLAARQAAAGGDDVIRLQRERLDRLGFELAEPRLAVAREDLGDRAAFPAVIMSSVSTKQRPRRCASIRPHTDFPAPMKPTRITFRAGMPAS